MPLLPAKTHRLIYYSALAVCVAALPLSVFLISFCQVILLLNWLLEEPVLLRWKHFVNNKVLWFIPLFYLVHLLGLLNTTDFNFGLHDVHIKLPFLMIPLIIGTSEKIPEKWIKFILGSFISGVFISSCYSSYKIFTISGDIMAHMIEISPFVWHIRLSIMSVLAASLLPWLFFNEKKIFLKIIYVLLCSWFVLFLFILQSLTGLFIFAGLLIILAFYLLIKNRSLLLRWLIIVGSITIFYIIIQSVLNFYIKNFSPLPVNIHSLEKFTINGNPYFHNPIHTNIENGNYVDLYLCNIELEKEWMKRGHTNIDSMDINHVPLRYTLIRYLTSKGLRKDSVGITQLSDEDISNIKKGIANAIYTEKAGIKSRIYRTMWELYHYFHGANPSGYSVAMRIEYLKTSLKILKRNFWFGTGTGDVLKEFRRQYITDQSQLEQKWRLRGHNQLITFWLTFGVFGFILIVISIVVPPVILGKFTNYLFVTFFIVLIISMFSDDTLETQAGISLFSIFYSLFLFQDIPFIYTLPEKSSD